MSKPKFQKGVENAGPLRAAFTTLFHICEVENESGVSLPAGSGFQLVFMGDSKTPLVQILFFMRPPFSTSHTTVMDAAATEGHR